MSHNLTRYMAAAALAAAFVPAASRADDAPAPVGVTFNKDVAPIFRARCEECHRSGQMAPMSLLSYAEVRPWVKSIKKSVAARDMPPWDADPAYGHFTNDISLTSDQIATIVSWVDAGAPEGAAADLPPARVWKDAEWKSGPPDIHAAPAVAFEVPPTHADEDIYQCIIVPTGLTKDTWLRGLEYRIDKPQVVHHVIGFLDDSGKSRELDAQTPEPGYPCGMGGAAASGGLDAMLGGWAPGMPPNIYEAGIGKMVKANSDIVLQMHYHNETGETFKDATSVGIYLATETIHHKGRIMPVSQFKLHIAAGDDNSMAEASWRIPRNIEVYTLMPHMHFIGKDMTLTAKYADGSEEILLSVPKYDFNWQTVYHFKEHKLLPKDTVLHVVGHHNNSADNPANPSKPPKDVTWGESTTEEMMIGWVGYVNADEDLNINPLAPATVGEAAPAKEGEKVSSATN